MTLPSLAEVSSIVEACGREVVLPAFRNLADVDIGLKGPNDYVTDIDIASERYLTERLAKLLPGAAVVGEETATDEPAWRETLRSADQAWVIDPIDGTANFAAGISIFGILVALVQKGITTHAWVHDPISTETAVAERGAGAWIGTDRLHVAQNKPAAHMQGCLNLRFAAESDKAGLVAAIPQIAPTLELRCAVQIYLNAAAGRSDFAVFHKMYPWDHAAGVLLHAEAGGYSRHLDGTAYRPDGPAWGNPILLAPRPDAWAALHALLFPGSLGSVRA
ncbi:MAG: inositol monophosphatase [Alphaproteobacteria bacterium]